MTFPGRLSSSACPGKAGEARKFRAPAGDKLKHVPRRSNTLYNPAPPVAAPTSDLQYPQRYQGEATSVTLVYATSKPRRSKLRCEVLPGIVDAVALSQPRAIASFSRATISSR